MLKSDKRLPACEDTDPMPFGQYQGTPMQDVPPRYLLWLHEQGCRNIRVANYIFNSMDALKMETGDKE